MKSGLLPLSSADIEPEAREAFARDFDARHAMEMSRTISAKRQADAVCELASYATWFLGMGTLIALGVVTL